MLLEALAGFPTGSFLLWTMLLAFGFDLLLGDPPWLYRVIPHPVALIGRFIDWGEAILNRQGDSGRRRYLRGLCLTLITVTFAAIVGLVVHWACGHLPWSWAIEALIASSLLAFRGLHDHVRAVAEGLAESLTAGQLAVGKIVGRDPDSLDEAGVARAAAESLAENFSDGVVAPLFCFTLFGLPGLCAYKALNTLDSMIGYRNQRYEDFGRAAARLDDWVNWLPARLAGGLMVLAAALTPGADAKRAWQAMRRDAPKHRSPNAGWQEAALAGALDFALAGPRHYPGEVVDDPWMGDGRRDLTAHDLRDALGLYRAAGAIIAITIGAVAFLFSL